MWTAFFAGMAGSVDAVRVTPVERIARMPEVRELSETKWRNH
jgi:hypothetical protein